MIYTLWDDVDEETKIDDESSKIVENEDPNDVVDDIIDEQQDNTSSIEKTNDTDITNDIFEIEDENTTIENNSSTNKKTTIDPFYVQIENNETKEEDIFYEEEDDDNSNTDNESAYEKTIATESFSLPDIFHNNTKISTEDFNIALEDSTNRSQTLTTCQYKVFRTNKENGGFLYSTFIYGIINELSNFVEIIDCLENANENDDFYIFLESPGGYVTTGAIVSSVIEASKANIYTVAIGEVASAASLIWSSGKHCIVKIMAMLMYHMSSHQDAGNSALIKQRASDLVRYVEESLLATAVKKGHITKEEVAEISETASNKWFDGEVIESRLKACGRL